MSVLDLEELLNNIFSPVLKKETMISGTGFLAVAAREAAAIAGAEAKAAAEKAAQKAAEKAKILIEKAKRETLQVKILTIMRLWHKGSSFDLITDVVDLPPNRILELLAAFEKVKAYCDAKAQTDMKELKKLSGLLDADLRALLALLQPQK